ncbi:MAG: ThuA domain-containing protein [Chitinophagaceae bacterium]|jgi:type 1 glutamine amidotransferase|nr:ThuA domain-containing protein [Chitinophagaceae bacterium]
MRRCFFFLSLALLLASFSSIGQSVKGARVLVFSKTKGFRHASIVQGKALWLELAAKYRFEADTTENADDFNEANLGRYQVVVFLSTTGDVLNEAQQQAFQQYIRAGGTFFGIHGAADTEYQWPWYNQLAGAYFKDHPKPQNASYINLDSTHPATRHWPAVFNRFEEIYNFKDLQKDKLRFLLAVDESSYEGGGMGTFHPMAWCHEFEGGKAFYTALGHHPETYADPAFKQHLMGALQWLLGK